MGVLTDEEMDNIKDTIIGLAETELQGRKLLSRLDVDAGVQVAKYDKLTDMGAAEILTKFNPGTFDTIDLSRKSKNVEILHKGFSISRIDLLSSRRGTEALNLKSAKRATRKVAELENDMIFNGKSYFGIKGMLDVVNNTGAAGAVWSAATETNNPYADILAAESSLNSHGFDASFVLCDPTNYGELSKKVTNSGGTWMELVKANVTPNVLKDKNITHGTIIVGDMGEEVAELAVAEDFFLTDPNIEGQPVYNFHIWDRVIPMFYEYDDVDATADKSDAYYTITGA